MRHGYLRTETKVYDFKDPENSRVIHEKMDRKGRMLERIEFDTMGRQQEKWTYSYTKNSKTENQFDDQNNLITQKNWKYGFKNKVTQLEEIQFKKNRTELTLIAYNKWGEKVSEKIYRNQTLIKIRTFDYDDEGLLIGQTTTDAEGKVLYSKRINYLP